MNFICSYGIAVKLKAPFILRGLLHIGVIAVLGLQAKAMGATGTPECRQLSSSTQVLECALRVHPEIQEARVLAQEKGEQEGVAAQIPNPELSSKFISGDTVDGKLNSVELGLEQTFELGGKRDARIKKSEAESTLAAAELLKVQEKVYRETITALYRLRQAQAELKILSEALQTFSKLQKTYRSRSKLSPDQHVSLQIMELAEGDYKGRKLALETEILSQNKEVELATGQDLSQNSKILPPRKTNWPNFAETELGLPLEGSDYRVALADLQLSKARLSLEQSLSIPDVKAGPIYQKQTQGLLGYQTFGIGLSLPLPLFHLNGAGRAAAGYGVTRTEIALTAAKKEVVDQREIYLRKYQGAIQILKTSLSDIDIDRRRKKTQGYFEQGLVSGALAIEAHRQVLDYTKSLNEQELNA